MQKSAALIAVGAIALALASGAAAGSRVIFAKRAAAYETHLLLKDPKVLSGRCRLATRRKLTCRLEWVYSGQPYKAQAVLVPLTLHSYRETVCIDDVECKTWKRRTADHSKMITIRS
jgi:hypothetical protein